MKKNQVEEAVANGEDEPGHIRDTASALHVLRLRACVGWHCPCETIFISAQLRDGIRMIDDRVVGQRSAAHYSKLMLKATGRLSHSLRSQEHII